MIPPFFSVVFSPPGDRIAGKERHVTPVTRNAIANIACDVFNRFADDTSSCSASGSRTIRHYRDPADYRNFGMPFDY